MTSPLLCLSVIPQRCFSVVLVIGAATQTFVKHLIQYLMHIFAKDISDKDRTKQTKVWSFLTAKAGYSELVAFI
jgi:hypothetical protein